MANRIWRFLPPWLKRKPQLDGSGNPSLIWSLCLTLGAALDLVTDTLLLMRARGLSHRAYPSYTSYYGTDPDAPSEDRKDDLYLIGAGRGQYKRPGETWSQFELRLQQFPSDVRDYGTVAGLFREFERLAFEVEYLEDEDENDRFILLSAADQCLEPEDNISHIFGTETLEPCNSETTEDPSVRGTRIFSGDEEAWTFNLRLSDPNQASLASTSEVVALVQALKPAYTKCWLFLPDQQYALEVI